MVLYTTSQCDPRSVFILFNNIIIISGKQKTRILLSRTAWKCSLISSYHYTGVRITKASNCHCTCHLGSGQQIYSLALNQTEPGLELSPFPTHEGLHRQMKTVNSSFWNKGPFTKKAAQKPKHFCRKLGSLNRAFFCRKTFCQKILMMYMY